MPDFDVVIIGSGGGGAPIAHELADAGRRVLVLEKGPLLRSQQQDPRGLSDFKRDELFATGPEKKVQITGVANTGRSFYQSHIEPDLNDEPHLYREQDGSDVVTIEGYTAQAVGGGTLLYGAVSLRFSELDFRLKSLNDGRTDIADDPTGDVQREARDWPFTYDVLEPYYSKAERLIGINGTQNGQLKRFGDSGTYQTPIDPNPISRFALAGMQSLGMQSYRTPLAVITEDHAPSGRAAGQPKTGYVNRYGDPMGFKSSTWVALLAPAMARNPNNLELRPNCHVTHLESDGANVTNVHYRDPSGVPQTVSGKIVVVACSAIETARLLMLSAREDGAGFGARLYANNDLPGKYFLTHCFGGAEVQVPADARADKSVSLDSDWATDFCSREQFIRANGLWAGGAIYNNTSDQALPISLCRTHGAADLDRFWDAFMQDAGLRGETLLDFFDAEVGRGLSVSFMANQVPLPTNRIELHPTVTDKWGLPCAYIIKDWHTHDGFLMNVMARQCEDVLLGGVPGVTRDDIGEGGVYGQVHRIANHVLGGARFGTDRTDSVLNPDCRVWEFDNLYVTDGAFMPTSGGANPTLTIQANAFRVADVLKQIV